MSRYRRLEILQMIKQIGFIPIFYHPDKEVCVSVTEACVRGGALLVELVNRSDGLVEIFQEIENHCKKYLPQAVLGVGSIIDEATAALFINQGANFIVGPCFDEGVARLCNKRKIPYIPGCGTVKEIHEAEALGVEICKIFPAEEIGGANFIKAVLGPCPWSSLMPTGGIEPTKKSLEKWFKAGAVSVGIGNSLISKDILAKKNYQLLTQKVKETISIIKELKKQNQT